MAGVSAARSSSLGENGDEGGCLGETGVLNDGEFAMNADGGGGLGDTGLAGAGSLSMPAPPCKTGVGPGEGLRANGDSGRRGEWNGEVGVCRGDIVPKGELGGGLGDDASL